MTLDNPYPKALVPEHLTSLTIEKIPLDTPFYLVPGGKDDYEPPIVFVDAKRQLKISKSANIDIDQTSPVSPIGLVGVMKTIVIDTATKTLREVYIADLRFMEDYQLVDGGSAQFDNEDQEDYMHWVALMNDSIVIDGFIASEHGADIDEDVPKGTFYGDERLHDSMKFLRKKGSKIMKKFMKHQAIIASNSPKEDKKQDTKDAVVSFSSK